MYSAFLINETHFNNLIETSEEAMDISMSALWWILIICLGMWQLFDRLPVTEQPSL